MGNPPARTASRRPVAAAGQTTRTIPTPTMVTITANTLHTTRSACLSDSHAATQDP